VLGFVRDNGTLTLEEDRDFILDARAGHLRVVCPTCDNGRLFVGSAHNLVRRKRILRLAALSDNPPECFQRRPGQVVAMRGSGEWAVVESTGIVTYSPLLFDALYEPETA